MLDRTIPFFNIIMRCDRILPMEIKLPEGYAIRTYQPGDEDAWATLMCAAGEQTSVSDAKELFMHGITTCTKIWGIPEEKVAQLWIPLREYMDIIPLEAIENNIL